MRAFLAVDVDEKLVNEISEVQKKLSDANAQLKFVEPENLHFTFKFFGEISLEKSEEIIEVVQKKIEKHHPFPINIKGMGVFPHMGYMRVIWLGVEQAEAFSRMLKDFDETFIKMGFKKEKSYDPHLTIVRVKGAQNKEALAALIKELEGVEIGEMTVDKMVLKESELTPAGPIYTNLKEFELK
jgi:RNA 2',3'-cyclic 3'-phosphodiesterase